MPLARLLSQHVLRLKPGDRQRSTAAARTRSARKRELADPQTLRALAHPIRLALLEALELHEPLTATQAGELIGEPPNTCSFHFRQLAKYGFIEEAEPAPGRSTARGVARRCGCISPTFTTTPRPRLPRAELDRMLRARYFARLEAFYASRADYPRAWQETTGASQAVLHVTPEELRTIDEQGDGDPRVATRIATATRRAGRRTRCPIEVLLFAYPARAAAK